MNMRAFGGRPGSGGGVGGPMSGMSVGSRAVVTLSAEGGGVCGRRCCSGGTFRKIESCVKLCFGVVIEDGGVGCVEARGDLRVCR